MMRRIMWRWNKKQKRKRKAKEKKSQRKGKIWSFNGAKDPREIKNNYLIWKMRSPILTHNTICLLK